MVTLILLLKDGIMKLPLVILVIILIGEADKCTLW